MGVARHIQPDGHPNWVLDVFADVEHLKSTLTGIIEVSAAGTYGVVYELREGEIYELVIDQIERALIDRALSKCGGVKTKAADFLGINRNTLNKKVKELGIEAID